MRSRGLLALSGSLLVAVVASGGTVAATFPAQGDAVGGAHVVDRFRAPRAHPSADGRVAEAAAAARPTGAARPCRLAAAGDVAGDDDWRRGAGRTGRLIRAQRPSRVVALGDLAYDRGSARQFRRWYQPTWGAFRRATLAIAGNHEYETSGAAGLAGYFGASSRRNRSVNLCHGWRVVLLNIYSRGDHVDPRAVRRAAAFVLADARRHPHRKLIAAWHVPRFSSGEEHGDDSSVARLWSAAVRARVRVVLNAHDHHYERFRPVGRGRTVQFISGLGGHHLRGLRHDGPARGSARRFTGTPAVLFLRLRSNGYSWWERTVTGRVVDRGTRRSAAAR